MCGIFGYVGKKERNSIEVVLQGLKKLEYRGYDSAGIAGIDGSHLVFCKEVGKVSALEALVAEKKLRMDLAIAQTRWATHGKPSQENAHPHFDADRKLAVVHNGIVENYDALRRFLKEHGCHFRSETDTEVIAQLIGFYYKGNILEAVQKAVPHFKGSFAFALIHENHPNQIIAVAHAAPLVIGVGEQEAFIASDTHAFAPHTRRAVFLADAEIAVIQPDRFEVFNAAMEPVEKEPELLTLQNEEISKGHFKHYTLKEIHEQPQTIRNALYARYSEEYGNAIFEELSLEAQDLLSIERILILACGTSWHAGYVASYLIEEMARIPVQVEISSEFRYKNPVVPPGTFVIAISQSGETADTLAALRELKAKGAKVLGICNVYNSTLVREADETLFLRAGPEVGVCSTKAFTSQIAVLALFTLLLSRMRHVGKYEGQQFLQALKLLPEQVQLVLERSPEIQKLAKKYAGYSNFFYLGRNYMYPTALEGALKLKEISYVNANGYPAGEMKHGPIALIHPECPTVAFCANKLTAEKMLSNLMEVKARSGKILAIVEEGESPWTQIADDLIIIPQVIDQLAAIPSTVAAQLFAYYFALERGEDIDQPRNLAKSVTVE